MCENNINPVVVSQDEAENPPKLLALLDCLPEAERELLQVAVTSLLLFNKGELAHLTKDQVELAENILSAGE
jgi:hypothetical protein